MTLDALARAFFAEHPELRFGALGPAENLAALPDAVCGQPVVKLSTEEHPHLPEQYLASNHLAFGKLSLLRWVLSDLFLMPGFIGVLSCEARHITPDLKAHLGVDDQKQVIGAAYVPAPTMHQGQFIGASLLSFLDRRGGAAWVKTLSLKLCGARRLRGVAQWDNPSLRVHTRIGPMRLIGRPPGGHEYADRTFVYETDLTDEATWARSMAKKRTLPESLRRVQARDHETLNALLERAAKGTQIAIHAVEGQELLIQDQ